MKGEDLLPQFTGYYFAFELRGTPRNLVTENCYISRDFIWKIYSKKEPAFVQNIINLMKHKIDSSNPPPSLNDVYKPQKNTNHLIDGETIWEAMIRACREEDVSPFNVDGAFSRGMETSALNILQNPKTSPERKNNELLHLFDGYCPSINWSKLNDILKKFPISAEVEAKIQEAKKLTFVYANIYAQESEIKEMLKFPEIVQYSKSPEYQKEIESFFCSFFDNDSNRDEYKLTEIETFLQKCSISTPIIDQKIQMLEREYSLISFDSNQNQQKFYLRILISILQKYRNKTN